MGRVSDRTDNRRQPRGMLGKQKSLWAPLTLALTGVLLLVAPVVHAGDACTKAGRPVPDCVRVSSPQIKVTAWQTTGWALYCPQSAPFYWNWTWAADKPSSGLSVGENFFVEGPSKGDWTITNWSLATRDVTITMGCSKVSPTGAPCDWNVCMNALTGCQAEECQTCLTQFACGWQYNTNFWCDPAGDTCYETSWYKCNDGPQYHSCMLIVDKPPPPPH